MATGFRDTFDFSRIAAPRLGSQVLAAANLAATWTNCAFSKCHRSIGRCTHFGAVISSEFRASCNAILVVLRYNHSSFIDLIISAMIGLRAAASALLTINPLLSNTTRYFAVDSLR